jgi:hypothetical protein
MILKAVDVQNEQIVECILGADPHHKCEMLPNFSDVWDLRSELSTTVLRVFFHGNRSDQTRVPPWVPTQRIEFFVAGDSMEKMVLQWVAPPDRYQPETLRLPVRSRVIGDSM